MGEEKLNVVSIDNFLLYREVEKWGSNGIEYRLREEKCRN